MTDDSAIIRRAFRVGAFALFMLVTVGSPRTTATAPGPVVVAHRGSHLAVPENTVPAMALARAGGFPVEIDVRYTADEIPVLMHDPTVDRTTNGTGLISSLTFAQARSLVTDDSPYVSARVPTLWEALHALEGATGPIFVELKVPAPSVAALQRTILAVIHTGTWPRVVFTSFDPTHVFQARDYARAQYGWIPQLGRYSGSTLPVSAYEGMDWAMMNLQSAVNVTELQAAGLHVGVWTINDPGGWAASSGVEVVVTDKPDEAKGYYEAIR